MGNTTERSGPVTTDEIREAIDADSRLARHVAHVQISTRRKTLGMAMSPGDSGITVQVPADATPGEVIRLLLRNLDRIGALLNRAKRCVPDHPVKEFVGGEGFLWLGRSARLRLVDNPGVKLRHASGYGTGYWFELDRGVASSDRVKTFIDWYSREGTVWVQEDARQLWSRMAPGRPMPTVKVANIGRTRWGKHVHRPGQERDEVTLAWQTLQLPPALVRHVLTHELVHATHPSGTAHGPEFWRAFNRTEIGARENARRLNEDGRHVWMGDAR